MLFPSTVLIFSAQCTCLTISTASSTGDTYIMSTIRSSCLTTYKISKFSYDSNGVPIMTPHNQFTSTPHMVICRPWLWIQPGGDESTDRLGADVFVFCAHESSKSVNLWRVSHFGSPSSVQLVENISTTSSNDILDIKLFKTLQFSMLGVLNSNQLLLYNYT